MRLRTLLIAGCINVIGAAFYSHRAAHVLWGDKTSICVCVMHHGLLRPWQRRSIAQLVRLAYYPFSWWQYSGRLRFFVRTQMYDPFGPSLARAHYLIKELLLYASMLLFSDRPIEEMAYC